MRRSDISGMLCIFSTRTAQQVCYLPLTRISSASVYASINSSRRCRKLCRKFDLRGAQVEYDSAISSHAIFLQEHSRRCVKCLPREEESECRAPPAISSRCRRKRSGKARSSTRIHGLIVSRSKCKFASTSATRCSLDARSRNANHVIAEHIRFRRSYREDEARSIFRVAFAMHFSGLYSRFNLAGCARIEAYVWFHVKCNAFRTFSLRLSFFLVFKIVDIYQT